MFFIIIRTGTFYAPAWLVLPLWFVFQLASLSLEIAGSDNVAYSAHAGGFAFGLALAFLFKLTGMEDEMQRSADLAAGEWFEDPRLEQARARLEGGDARGALRTIGPLVEEQPQLVEARELMVKIGEQMGNWRLYHRNAIACLDHWSQHEPGRILDAYRFLESFPEAELSPEFLARATDTAGAAHDLETVTSICRRLLRRHPQHPALAQALFTLGALYRERGQPEPASGVFGRLAQAFPDSPWTEQARRLGTGA